MAFKTRSVGRINTGGLTQEQRFMESWPIELLPFSYTGNITGGTIGTISNSIFAGTVMHADGLYLETSRDIDLLIQTNAFPTGNQFVTSDEGWVIRTVQAGRRVFKMDLYLDNSKEVRVTTTEAVGSTPVSIQAGFINPKRLPMGVLNFTATRVLYVIGDSISTGKNVPLRQFRTYDMHYYQLENALNDLLVEAGSFEIVRVANKAYGGRDITHFLKWEQEGQLSIEQADVILIGFGTNEAFNSYTGDFVTAGFQTLFEKLRRRYRNTHVIFTAAPPLYDDTVNARLIALRASISAWVTGMQESVTGISYQSYESVMSEPERKDLANYNGSDGVHPGTFTIINRMAALLKDHVGSDGVKQSVLNALRR